MSNYCIVRTDLMSGTKQPADMVSLRFYTGTGSSKAVAAVENGVIAELVALESETVGSGADAVTTYQREVWEAKAATSSSSLDDCVLIATPEVMYDERKRSLHEFINEAGVAARGYRLRDRNIFSVSAEGITGETAPAVGDGVVITTGGKLTKAGSGASSVFGKVIHIETVGSDTFYAIQITK